MPANTEPLHEASDPHNYYYRRQLGPTELIPALVLGIGAGLLGFYVARLLAERTPLVPERTERLPVRRRPRATGEAG